jgi:hypothetical protein
MPIDPTNKRDRPLDDDASVRAYLSCTAHWSQSRFMATARSDPEALLSAAILGPVFINGNERIDLVAIDSEVYDALKSRAEINVLHKRATATVGASERNVVDLHRRLIDRAWRLHEYAVLDADVYEAIRARLDVIGGQITELAGSAPASPDETQDAVTPSRRREPASPTEAAIFAALGEVSTELDQALNLSGQSPAPQLITIAEVADLLAAMARGDGILRLTDPAISFASTEPPLPWCDQRDADIPISFNDWRLVLRRRTYGFDHIVRIESPDGRTTSFEEIATQGDPRLSLTIAQRDTLERRLERLEPSSASPSERYPHEQG